MFISGDELWSAPAVLMAIGAIVFIIAFLGCCGAIKESSCMVLTVSYPLAARSIFPNPNEFTFDFYLHSVLAFVDRDYFV